MDNVAITGIGVISSIGHDLDSFSKRLEEPRAAVERAPWADSEGLEYAWCSPVHGFECEEWMDERIGRGTDRYAQYMIAAAEQARQDSGVEFDPLRTAVVTGTSMAGVQTMASSQHGLSTEGPEGVDRKLQLKAWSNISGGQIALRYGLHGPLYAVSTACASSSDAIGLAARLIESGQVDMAIAGGSDSAMTPLTFYASVRYGMASPGPDPTKVCLPFDVNRSGVLEGEGAGAFILERADKARERGAKIHALLRGYANLSDAYHPTSPTPSGEWEALTMRQALADAGIEPSKVGAIIAHGTGTPVGDTAEIRAINDVFVDESRLEQVAVASIKGHVGHTAGAAGVMGLMAAIHGLKTGRVIPTAGTKDVEEEAGFQVVIDEPLERELQYAQVNAFGFGGQNSSIIVSEA